MNDRISLLASGLLILFFLIGGILDILENFMIKLLLFAGFFAIITNVIITKSKEDDPEDLDMP